MSAAREVADRLRKKRPVEKVSTDEGTVYVRGLSGKERQSYMEMYSEFAEPRLPRLLADHNLVAIAICDENGAALYESHAETLEVISDWTIDVVNAAAAKVCEISGLSSASASATEKK